jgi:RHS repeat-associated protein
VTTYEYDLNDNRVSTAAPSGLVTATYDNQDRLITYGDAAYTYTAYGDLQQTVISGETTTYSYDVFSNLRAVALPNGTNVEYIIDGVNRRVGKKVNGVLVQAFLYQDRMNPVAELNGANEVISRFVYGTRPHVPDFMIKDGQTYRIVSDQIGNVRLVVNVATGEIAQRIDYDPFGRITRNSNAGFQPFGYGGGLYDDMTGLVRFGARDYDPVTGRWTTKDPQGLGGGHPNLYLFAFNDPVSLRDPFGLNPCDGVWGTPQAIFCAIMPPFGREYDYELADRDSHSGKCGSLFGDEATTHRRKRNGSPRPHYGIDLKAPLGTPIYAAVDGVITQSRDRGTPGAGNGVELTVTTEFGTIVFDYFHMDELAFDLMLGETREVMAGEMIGTSGFTGFEVSETDPHVHFQIKVNGTEIDPMALVAYFWKFRKCKCAQ